MTCACLVDTTRCIGCRTCQVACKQAHGLKAEKTKFYAAGGGYQNPPRFSPYTRTYVSFHEVRQPAKPGQGGRLKWVFVKRQCMHCTDMRCAAVCAPVVFHRTASGVVLCDSANCIGCAACVDECPFEVPTIDYWDVSTPHMRKCTFCFERQEARIDRLEVDGKPLSGEALRRYQRSLQTPACAKACPTGALKFGDRDELLAGARRRIAAAPDKYVNYVYGEKELGGLGWLYLASVPFEQLGLPTTFVPPPELRGMGFFRRRRRGLSWMTGGIGTLLAGMCWFFQRRDEVRNTNKKDKYMPSGAYVGAFVLLIAALVAGGCAPPVDGETANVTSLASSNVTTATGEKHAPGQCPRCQDAAKVEPALYDSGYMEDNQSCLVCHLDFEKEEISAIHLEAGVTCAACHGDSEAHRGDEWNVVRPDVLWGRAEMVTFCKQCHPKHKTGKVYDEFVAEWLDKRRPTGRYVGKESVCMDCHGEHSLTVGDPQFK